MSVDDQIHFSSDVADRLIEHYAAHARVLPWRAPFGAKAPDPYSVWLSEVMLQQTTVAAVTPYFERFMTRWPDVKALAEAQDADLMAAWAGLGYYARARNLLACARTVVRDHGGRFPRTEPELRALPGIGVYTAAAIAAIAFGARAVVVDGNVERVVARLSALEVPLPAAKPLLRALTDHLTPEDQCGDFAQAMMDLGATICTPRSPDCARCPLAFACRALAQGDPARFPIRAKKQLKPVRQGVAWWVEVQGHVWLVTRPKTGLLGGMRALPSTPWRVICQESETKSIQPQDAPPLDGEWISINASVRHIFTHFTLDLGIARIIFSDEPNMETISAALGDGLWWPLDDLAEAGLPTVFMRAAKAAIYF